MSGQTANIPRPSAIHSPVPQLAELGNARPALLGGPMVWEGKWFSEDENRYIFTLSDIELLEIEAALAKFKASRLILGALTPETYPLPQLGPKLRLLSQRLHHGAGFFIIRGLNPKRYDKIDNTIIHVGISSYIGNRRGIQHEGGPAMSHIFDYSSEIKEKEADNNGYLGHANRNTALPFHTDEGHVIALYCLQSACKGGRSSLASSWTILNRLAAQRPDVIETLTEDWVWDSYVLLKATKTPSLTRSGGSLRKDVPSFKRPLLSWFDGKLLCSFRVRPFLGSPGYPRNPALEPLSARQLEALKVVADIANDVALTFDFKTGDLQYIHNLSILHAREAFETVDSDKTRRHLLRLILKDDELSWKVPPSLAPLVDDMYEHRAEDEIFPWSAEPLAYVAIP